jgi:tetratricopeptide (TPR) repeat protein
MQKNEIDKISASFNQLMIEKKLKEALDVLTRLLTAPTMGIYSDEVLRISETYRNLTRYAVQGIQDPQQDRIYHNIQLDLYELFDRMKNQLLRAGSAYGALPKLNPEQQAIQIREQVKELFENINFESELKDVLSESELFSEDSGADKKSQTGELVKLIFDWAWFAGKFKDTDKELIQNLLKSERLHWYEKCLIVSAVSMGLIRNFDQVRFEILFDAYDSGESQIAERALTGLLLALFSYDQRLFLYPQLLNRLKAVQGDEFFMEDVSAVIFQLLKAKETEKVTKKFRDEIIPDIIKNAPELGSRLGIKNLFSEDDDDKNPKWKKLFEDSPDLYKKFEEVSKMQLEGMDIFMSAFGVLKFYPFFHDLSNWFIPFHSGHPVVDQALSKENPAFGNFFMKGLMESNFICNSDKYSFCLSMGTMMSQQKESMVNMFSSELEAMKELENEEGILDSRRKSNSIITQYIQDLYRFFKVYTHRSELDDIFKLNFDFHNKNFMQAIVSNDDTWKRLADFYFSGENYQAAAEVFLKLAQSKEASQDVFEKIAYCFEKSGRYEEALAYYRKAELFDKNRVWNLRRIAQCHWMLQQYDQSVESLKEALQQEPDNNRLHITLANCYLYLKKYDTALHHYLKVELTSGENPEVLRPLAWCYFLTGKFEEAKFYYEKLMEDAPNQYDFMNLGHVFLCTGGQRKALDCYLESIRHAGNSLSQFLSGFSNDREHLIRHGAKPLDLTFMADYLMFENPAQE